MDFSTGFERHCHIKKRISPAVLIDTAIEERFQIYHLTILEKSSDYQDTVKKPGWIVKSVDRLDIIISKYTPICPSSYLALPPQLALKRSIVSPNNLNDTKCFLWALHSCSQQRGTGREYSSTNSNFSYQLFIIFRYLFICLV